MKYAVLILLVLLGCTPTDDKAAPDQRQAIISSIAQRVAMGNYQELVRATERLAIESREFCENPTSDGLEAVRQAWWNARAPLKITELIKFGPFVEYPLRIGPKLDDPRINDRRIEELVADDGGLEQSDFDTMGTATRGFPVVEYLLWAQGDDTLSGFMLEPRRCLVMAGASRDVNASSSRLLDSWENDWLERVTNPRSGDGDEYNIVQHVVDEWVNRMAFTVENIRITKLGKPLGDASGGNPLPDIVESRFSGRSLQDARDALTGVQQVWRGNEDSDELGIADLLSTADTSLVGRIDNFLRASSSQLASIPEPLSSTITEARDTIPPVQETLRSLQVAIQVELAQRLGVTVAFNDNDGD